MKHTLSTARRWIVGGEFEYLLICLRETREIYGRDFRCHMKYYRNKLLFGLVFMCSVGVCIHILYFPAEYAYGIGRERGKSKPKNSRRLQHTKLYVGRFLCPQFISSAKNSRFI